MKRLHKRTAKKQRTAIIEGRTEMNREAVADLHRLAGPAGWAVDHIGALGRATLLDGWQLLRDPRPRLAQGGRRGDLAQPKSS